MLVYNKHLWFFNLNFVHTVHHITFYWPTNMHHPIQATNNMQQFRFIDPFKSALRVSGANYAHPQEHSDCIYSFWYDTPTLLELHLNRVTSRQQHRCITPKAVNTECS
jgi:hypothetical protein